MALSIEYVELSELKKWPQNPKRHDENVLERSVARFGFVSPILVDERTGMIVAGHGRIETLERLKQDGQTPPSRIEVAEDGEWSVPVIKGVRFNSDSEMEAYAIADNRTSELGGWDEAALMEGLQRMAEGGEEALEGVGYEVADIEALQAFANMIDRAEGVPDLEFDKPLKNWRVIVCCDGPKEVKKLLAFLGLPSDKPENVRYQFDDTKLAEGEDE